MERRERIKWFLAGAGDLIRGFPLEAESFEHACEQTRQQMNWADGLLVTSDDQPMHTWVVTAEGLDAAKKANNFALWFTCQSVAKDPAIPQTAQNRMAHFASAIPQHSRLRSFQSRFLACPLHQVNRNGQQFVIECRENSEKEKIGHSDENNLVADCLENR